MPASPTLDFVTKATPNINAIVLDDLIRRGATSAGLVRKLFRTAKAIEVLERQLERLRAEGGVVTLSTPFVKLPQPTKPRATNTPKMRAARKRQGLYLYTLKRLGRGPAGQHIRAICKRDGVVAALKAAAKLGNLSKAAARTARATSKPRKVAKPRTKAKSRAKATRKPSTKARTTAKPRTALRHKSTRAAKSKAPATARPAAPPTSANGTPAAAEATV